MKRIAIVGALALLAAAPAAVGLIGNASFGQGVPVRVPTSAIVLDDHGGQGVEGPAGAVNSAAQPSAGPTVDVHGVDIATSVGQAPGAAVSPVEEHGGPATSQESDNRGAASSEPEPGDNRGGLTGAPEAGDDGRGDGGVTDQGDHHSQEAPTAASDPADSSDRNSGAGAGSGSGSDDVRVGENGRHGGADGGAGHS